MTTYALDVTLDPTATELLPTVRVRYRVHFRRQFDPEGNLDEHPIESLRLPKGMVLKAIIVEPEPLDNLSSRVRINEPDEFLNVETEAWEFDIVPDRKEQFIRTLKNSGSTVLHYEELSEEAT